ncbi:hypothetical protein PENNAL_c0010G06113 [Penicillium nalgiovense]|uniref:C2H2-type domain-containing protein n=1 Tax=Penicillium nalgiovense TaxID=60175 RepID=A0A1V6YUZ1_PENNA|nr:hypothetical protein PENNAL_c0010G06113 [Penicillium nalgiovense]
MSPPADVAPLWFQCDYPDCNAKYRRKEHLNRHRNHHNGETNLACPYCESVLTRKGTRRRLENPGHAVHVMHGKSAAKVYYHAMPVNIEASSVYLLEMKPQSVLLNIILALFIARENVSMDLSMRCRLPDDKYELLAALVQSCRQCGIFSYPNMLLQHEADAPLALVYVGVEEIKRFGLALYKVCRLSTSFHLTGESSNGDRNIMLTLADLSFCMPDSDELWNAPLGSEPEVLSKADLSAAGRDNGDAKNWISQASALSVCLIDGFTHFLKFPGTPIFELLIDTLKIEFNKDMSNIHLTLTVLATIRLI